MAKLYPDPHDEAEEIAWLIWLELIDRKAPPEKLTEAARNYLEAAKANQDQEDRNELD